LFYIEQMPGRIYTELADLANDNHGFITPGDARKVGVDPTNLVRMAERGQLERRGNALYRFPLVSPGPLDPYMEAALWPRGTDGVISHESALELYELSDVHPRRIHITVPRAHRIRRQIPAAYRIHHEDLDPGDVNRFQGVPIVTPEHAIRQAQRAGLGRALISQAVDHGERNGRLTGRRAKLLRSEMSLPKGSGIRR
jgi:predicted transcriptional regulator of viral defense system